LAEFAIDNKVYSAIKISLFMANYGRESRMEVNIRKKEKVVDFGERMKKVQKEAEAALKKVQEDIKR